MKRELGLILLIKILEWSKNDKSYTKELIIEDLELALSLLKAED